MEERLLTKSEVCKMVGYSKAHLARLVTESRFPKPVKPFGKQGRALWVHSEVQHWIAERIKQRDS